MRLLPFLAALFLLPGCAEEEEEDPVCADVCGDEFTVVAVSGSKTPFGFADISVAFTGESFSFTCENGRVKNLTDTVFEVSCNDDSFTVEGIAPDSVDVDLNGLYSDTLQPAYSSAHPSPDCTEFCRQAEVEWTLPV
ncbi:MAG: hypothetical protein ACI8PZ_003177 [Myxococcota bacterium]|jgi:hypothetical protein